MFSATKWQVGTYLVAVCPFSIAFLVFLNSSVSFVVTDLIGDDKGVGDAVGTLGFADELLALLACPVWGLLSDRIGVRSVCFTGYVIIGLALFVFVQAKNVYPHLLLARLLFSLGGSAASTMVTAILPHVSKPASLRDRTKNHTIRPSGHTHAPSVASDLTITPANFSGRPTQTPSQRQENDDSISKIAGFVGMATGCGALIALSVFLPLPARFQHSGVNPGLALQYSYYTVGATAFLLALVCLAGLRGLQNDDQADSIRDRETPLSQKLRAARQSLYHALISGFRRKNIFIGYVGGFVARASSVGISLFIPLLVNSAFLSSGLCHPVRDSDHPVGLPDIKRRCPRAYVVAAELTGTSQLIALISAPLFGYVSSKISSKTVPLVAAAVAGLIGYPLFANCFDPHDENSNARILAFLAVILIGISQIGAIVCSLSILTAGVLDQVKTERVPIVPDSIPTIHEDSTETATLLEAQDQTNIKGTQLSSLKGSVAGIYSFYGGAGILLLTKAGGALFDSTTTAAPFYMMASFNAILLLAIVVVEFAQ